mgnify:CR=1 FL=1
MCWPLQAALLAGRTNKALVGREEFSQAVLRSVAGIEKKRSILQGLEKDVVARHEVSAWTALVVVDASPGRCTSAARFCQRPEAVDHPSYWLGVLLLLLMGCCVCENTVSQVGQALVSTAVARLLPSSASVPKL